MIPSIAHKRTYDNDQITRVALLFDKLSSSPMFPDQAILDLRFALRGFKRRPGLALTIVGILALAIGALTAMYSLLDWIVVRPLPYPDSQRIYCIGFRRISIRGPAHRWRISISCGRPQADWNLVSSDYFSSLGIALVAGRLPVSSDLQRSKDLVLINQKMAQHYWPHETAIGKHICISGSIYKNGPWQEIIGVVKDVKDAGLSKPEEPQIYSLYPTLPPSYGYILLGTESAPLQAASAARGTIHQFDRDVPVDKVASMSEVLAQSVAAPRFRAILVGSFSFLALVLATLGIYGAVSYSVARRTREIGICMALGASPHSTFGAILASAGKLVIWGVLAGSIGAVAFMKALRTFLFSVRPLDGWVLMMACSILMAVGIVAALIPAHRAAEIDPAAALRHD